MNFLHTTFKLENDRSASSFFTLKSLNKPLLLRIKNTKTVKNGNVNDETIMAHRNKRHKLIPFIDVNVFRAITKSSGCNMVSTKSLAKEANHCFMHVKHMFICSLAALAM